MDGMGIDIAEIATLAGEVGVTGAIRAIGAMGDDMFEYVVGIAVIIYEMYPTTTTG